MADSGTGRDEAELRSLFEAELRVANLSVGDEDRERLFSMWADFLPQRDQLRQAEVVPEEEPGFIEKPTVGRGGR